MYNTWQRRGNTPRDFWWVFKGSRPPELPRERGRAGARLGRGPKAGASRRLRGAMVPKGDVWAPKTAFRACKKTAHPKTSAWALDFFQRWDSSKLIGVIEIKLWRRFEKKIAVKEKQKHSKSVSAYPKALHGFLFLFLFFLLLLLLCSRACCSGCQLLALPLLDHQLAVVLIARVIPGGLARREVKIVDVPIHILTAKNRGRGGKKRGYFRPTKITSFTINLDVWL